MNYQNKIEGNKIEDPVEDMDIDDDVDLVMVSGSSTTTMRGELSLGGKKIGQRNLERGGLGPGLNKKIAGMDDLRQISTGGASTGGISLGGASTGGISLEEPNSGGLGRKRGLSSQPKKEDVGRRLGSI